MTKEEAILRRIKALGISCDLKTKKGIKHFHHGHEYVEIGGMKWATMNIGASSIFDNGLYFACGETQGYTPEQLGIDRRFCWEDYSLSDDDGETILKYNDNDGKHVLEAIDDAAHIHLGGLWRIPRTDEFKALETAVNTSYVTDYQGSGTNGLVCIDKKDKSKELFFPSACYFDDDHFFNNGECGIYWSSSIKIGNIYFSHNLDFCDGNAFFGQNAFFGCCDFRSYGFSVRGIINE